MKLLVLVLLSGCSVVNDSSDHRGGVAADAGRDADAAPSPIEVADLCSALVAVYCEARIACCPAAEGEDVDQCRAERMRACQDVYGEVAADPQTGYDPEEAARVIAEGEALAAECDTDIVEWFLTRDGLVRMLEGTIQENRTCSIFDATYFACDKPLICKVQGLGTQCLDEAKKGDACATDYECKFPLQCEDRECAEPIREGGACQSPLDCESLSCGAGMTCEPRTTAVFCLDPFARE